MTAQLELAQRLPSTQRLGQATAVEQSRAVAEVEAAIVVAMRHPRSVPAAVEAMRETCKQTRLAERAFFRFPRGKDDNGKTQFVTGASVHLARELARVWGNFQYGISELARDADRSEMVAFAWDVQTNTRNSSTFIVPHARDTKAGVKQLEDLRDIYENNANAGARRVREAIFASLPTWFVEEAKELCSRTISEGGGKPLAQRVADAIATFGNIGITVGQLEAKTGTPSAKWTEHDVAQLSVIYRSVQRGEIRKDDEFPSERVTVAEVTAQAAKPADGMPADIPATPSPAETASNEGAKEEPADPRPAGKAAVEKLDRLVASMELGTDADVRELFEWLTAAPWTATRSQVQTATSYLDDHLKAAQGDVLNAANAAWAQYSQANPQAADDGA